MNLFIVGDDAMDTLKVELCDICADAEDGYPYAIMMGTLRYIWSTEIECAFFITRYTRITTIAASSRSLFYPALSQCL